MATYFYTKHDDGTMQIDDGYEAVQSIKSGSVSADITKGQLYGLALTAPAHCAAFRIDRGELFISPPTLYGSTMIYYVATNGSTPIYYEQFARSTSLSASSSLAGMELYDSAGKVVFTTKYRTYSAYIGHYAKFVSVREIDGAVILDSNPEFDFLSDAEMAFTYYAEAYGINRAIYLEEQATMGAGVPGAGAWSATVPAEAVIQSSSAPWLPGLCASSSTMNRVYLAGYHFTANANGTRTISIGGETMKTFNVTTILGQGALSDINRTDNYIPGTGATLSGYHRRFGLHGHGYIFNVFKPT